MDSLLPRQAGGTASSNGGRWVLSRSQRPEGEEEDEMAGWHHRLDGHESEWTPGVGDGQGGLACCDSWGRKELDTTERLNWTELTDSTGNITAENVRRSSLSFSHFHRLEEGGSCCFYSWVSPTLCSFCLFFYSCVVTLVLQCAFMYGGNMKIQPIQISLADSRFIRRMKIRGRA